LTSNVNMRSEHSEARTSGSSQKMDVVYRIVSATTDGHRRFILESSATTWKNLVTIRSTPAKAMIRLPTIRKNKTTSTRAIATTPTSIHTALSGHGRHRCSSEYHPSSHSAHMRPRWPSAHEIALSHLRNTADVSEPQNPGLARGIVSCPSHTPPSGHGRHGSPGVGSGWEKPRSQRQWRRKDPSAPKTAVLAGHRVQLAEVDNRKSIFGRLSKIKNWFCRLIFHSGIRGDRSHERAPTRSS
jgi:hypothetical protein